MNPEALRAALFAAGSTLIMVGGLDDALIAAGIPALGLLSATVSKLILALGTLMVGYGKTAKSLGDFRLSDVSDALRDTVAPAKSVPAAQAKAESLRSTDPGVGPSDK